MSRRFGKSSPLFDLIWTEAGDRRGRLLLALGISAFSNAGILALVNLASEASDEAAGWDLALLFAIAIIAYIVCQKHTFKTNVRIIEGAIEKIRLRLSNKIRHAELSAVEGVGRSEIYDAMTRATNKINNMSVLLGMAVQVGILGIFVAAYVALLSPLALVLNVVLLGIGLGTYRRKQKTAESYIRTETEKEIAFVDIVGHTLDGFKEARINARRSRDLHHEVASRAAAVKDAQVTIIDLFSDSFVFFQSIFYLLLGAVAFVLPRILSSYGEVVNEVSTAVLFISGPMFMLFNSFHPITEADLAVIKIRSLEDRLDELSRWTEEEDEEEPPPGPTSFRDIELVDLEYSYKESDGEILFTVGPTSLKIRSGETLFLVGGNGSGKSTLLNLLTALLDPDQGFILLDGKTVGERGVRRYRELFSAIFSDFHLFDKLYGLLDVDPERVRELLVRMQLEDKTSFSDGRFSNLDLSTGQRKRLALVVSLLDDRPIFVFDELAADQDPQFREHLYSELFAELKSQGKTIIAVSHDDRYFHLADRVLKMDYGQLVEHQP